MRIVIKKEKLKRKKKRKKKNKDNNYLIFKNEINLLNL